MERTGLLFEKNIARVYTAKFNSKSMCLEVRINSTRIDGMAIRQLLKVFSGIIEKYGRAHPPIFMDFSDVEFADKLTYIILECIIYCMISNYHFDVMLNISGKNKINASGWRNSPLIYLAEQYKEKRRIFLKKFEFILNGNHYRRVVREKGDKSSISRVYDDISDFIRNSAFELDESCRDEVAGVIAELISNAIEHGGKECLVDVDIAGGFFNKKDNTVPRKEYIGLSLVVLNISEKQLGEDLRKKMDSDIKDSLPDRYKKLSEALINHQKSFDDNYSEEDFYNIAVFQDKISGRYNTSKSGGTGMLKLIKALGDRAEGNNCYLLSGERIVLFQNEYMEYNDEGWIGFNESNDFIEISPDKGVIQSCDLFFPGVAYNLQFIMEREKNAKDNQY